MICDGEQHQTRLDSTRVTTCIQTSWEIGRNIIEFEQGGSARAEYGTRLSSQS